jgi:hypothetical protein
MRNYMIQENEIPKYLKSKESNISKSNRKSKHKHHYEEYLIQNKFIFTGKICLNTGLYTYCTICGKINERFKENKSIVKDYIKEVNSPIGKYKCYSRISDDELYKKYHDKLPVFFVEDIFKEKYVDLERENNTENNSEGE